YQRIEKRLREEREREFAEEAEWLNRLETQPTIEYYATLHHPDGSTSSLRTTGPDRDTVRTHLRRLHQPVQAIDLREVKRQREYQKAWRKKPRPKPPTGTGWLLQTEVSARTEVLDLEALADTLTQPDEPPVLPRVQTRTWLHERLHKDPSWSSMGG